MTPPKTFTISAFKSRIDTLTAQLLDRSKIIPIDYILSAISEGTQFFQQTLFVLKSPKLFRTTDEISSEHNFLILPYLSFEIDDGTLKRFSNAEKAYRRYDDFVDANISTLFDTPFVTIFVPSRGMSRNRQTAIYSIGQLLELYFHFYEYPQILQRSASRYAKLLSARDTTVTDFFKILQNISVDYNTTITYITRIGDNIETVFGQCPDEVTASSAFLNRYDYVVRRGQVASSFLQVPNGKALFFTLVPNIEPLSDPTIPLGCVAIFSYDEPLDEQVASFVAHFVSTTFQERARSTQSVIIERLNGIREDILSKIRLGECQTYSSRTELLSRRLRDWCERLVEFIGAHSVTIRLYNGFTQNLDVFVFYDKTVPSRAPIEIAVGDYMRSLNAAAFRWRAPSNPIRFDDIRELILPPDLKASGFRGPLNVRPRTVSEICAPIWSANSAIGTINLESPEKRGFINYDIFIGTVARHIGELFSVAHEALSLPTVLQLARANDAAHGAAGLELDAILMTVPSDIRSKLPTSLTQTIGRFEQFRKAYRKDILVSEEEGTGSIAALISQVNAIYDRCLVPMISEKSPGHYVVQFDDGEIPPPIALSILRTIELVFENAAKHSVIDADLIKITVGPEATLPRRRIFDLLYRSTKSPIEPDVLDSFGLVPIRKNGTMRYGAFLLGYQARALGGSLEVRRHESDNPRIPVPLEFRLTIPF